MTDLTQQFAKEAFLYYDGRLYWRQRPLHHFASQWHQRIFNARQAGTEAGTITHGYRRVNMSIGRFNVHQIIFLMHRGFLPPEVDHINGDTLDNHLGNLRAATHQQNSRNQKTSSKNTSGVKGVAFHKPTGKWAAYVRDDGKMRHLGLFESIDAAATARKNAACAVYGEFSNGR